MTRVVYKYCPAKRAADVVGRLRVRLSPPTALNDPFEARTRVEAFLESSTVARLFDREKLLPNLLASSFRDKLPGVVRRLLPPRFAAWVFGLVPEPKGIASDFARALNDLVRQPDFEDICATASGLLARYLEQLGAISVTRNPTNVVMWAHYAADGQGFLIELDATSRLFNDTSLAPPLGRLRAIRYYEQLPEVSLQYLPVHAEELRRAPELIFFRKLAAWEHEREMRILYPLAVADEVIEGLRGRTHLKAIPPNALRAIVLGANASSELAADLRQLVSQNPALRHVEFRRARVLPNLQRLMLVTE